MKSIFVSEVDLNKYIVAEYYLSSVTCLYDAAWNLAIGQSIGNPNVRNELETDELIDNHICKIIWRSNIKALKALKSGVISIAFPIANIDLHTDGISQLLCFLMGGQLDIGNITTCQLLDIHCPSSNFPTNTNDGIHKIRSRADVWDRPLLGGIIKPKTGLSPNGLLEMVKQLVDGGVNFIKEDEILGNPTCCTFDHRINVIQPYIESQDVVYCYCVNGDPHVVLNRCRNLHMSYPQSSKKGVHINVHSGLGMYNSIRKIYPDFFIHFQKSGDKLWTNRDHNFSIRWEVICKLAGVMGVDTIHAGMWGGYSSDSESKLKDVMAILHFYRVMPALSCGMHPGIVNAVTERFGIDYLANVGGALHGHPGGTLAGTLAMRQAIDGDYGKEYYQAVDKWGCIH